MSGIVLKKNGSKLEFIVDKEADKRVLYDFKDNSFTSYTGRSVKLSTAKAMFSKFGHRINTEESDPMYSKLIGMIKGSFGCPIYNLGSKLERLGMYKHTERYMTQGFNVDCLIDEPLAKSIDGVGKGIKNIYLKTNSNLNTIRRFTGTNKVDVVLDVILDRFGGKTSRDLVVSNSTYHWPQKVSQLMTLYNYNAKSLASYLCNISEYEALSISEATNYLMDFLDMNTAMGVTKLEKYPRHLHTTHDIVVRNYNSFKVEHSEEFFSSIRRVDLEHKGKEYSIVYPTSYKDIQKEGASLNHCVASYVERVMNGTTHILFLRKTSEIEESLVTVEVRDDRIVQYKGSYNRGLTEKEIDFLKTYAEKKKLKLG
ncbi:MAG: PcfJ domain-containing protein [Cetobacterium sp.]